MGTLLDLVEREGAAAHLAAMAAVRYSAKYPLIYGTVNVQGTANLLEALAELGVRLLVFSSSCAVYGRADPLPAVKQLLARLRPGDAAEFNGAGITTPVPGDQTTEKAAPIKKKIERPAR